MSIDRGMDKDNGTHTHTHTHTHILEYYSATKKEGTNLSACNVAD